MIRTRPSRKKDFQSIVWMLFVLVTIVLVILQLNRHVVYEPAEFDLLPAGKRIAVVDSVYFHLPFYLTWRLPNTNWHFTYSHYDSVLHLVDASVPLSPQIAWLATAVYEDKSAKTKLGILEYTEKPDYMNEAITLLYEMMANYPDSSKVITPVTKGAHHVLGGVYFLLKIELQNNLIICAVLPRNNSLYIIQSSTSQKSYAERRADLEKCVSQFRVLSMLK